MAVAVVASATVATTDAVAGRAGTGPRSDSAAFVTVRGESRVRDQLPPDVKVGATLQSAHGQMVRVVALSEESAVVDLNHPLAGKDLVFDVTILKVEKPEAEPSSETKE